jgi:hypothetical protein
MATQTWIAGRIGAWFTAANWTSGIVPSTGDTVIVGSGMPEIDSQTIVGEHITLGGSSNGSTVTLLAHSALFEPLVVAGEVVSEQSLTITGGDPASHVTATLLSQGVTTYAGQIIVEAVGGTLTIDAESFGATSGNFTFTNPAGNTFVLVTQESSLHFEGEAITTAGVIEVEGFADVAAGVSFGGNGIVMLDDGGQMSIAGTVGTDVAVDFADGSGKLTIADAAGFQGTIGFTNLAGDRIDLTGVLAQSERVDAGVLRLFSGPNGTGTEVAHLNVRMVDPESLNPTGPPLQTEDFSLASDGNGGTLITYTPLAPTYLEASLPAPVVATASTMVSLTAILMQSFGTTTPSPYGITLVAPDNLENTPTDQEYWVNPDIPPAESVVPAWYVNGHLLEQPSYTVQPNDVVELQVGNNISGPAQIQVQLTPAGTGPSAGFVTYDVWTVDPNVAALVQAAGAQAGHPTPADVVAAARSWNTTFPDVPNTDLCNWIADNVAAAAGAPMPLPNALFEPGLNVSGGFWRVVYSGGGPAPVQDWYTLVQPGDIVRMQWFKPESPSDISGHTTTVLGTVNPNGTISVYDNINHVNDVETIGIHAATYWPLTDPASITIYRLDPNHQYLIQGTSLAEVIHGSVYDNLIRPGGGADIITGGTADNEFQDTTAHLNGIVVTDFHFGDVFDFTDLNPAQVTVAYTGAALLVFSNNVQVAAITLPGLSASENFVVTPDGHGGSLIELDPSSTPWTLIASGDFNGDGISDLLWQDPSTGGTIEWLMSRNGGVGSIPTTPSVEGWSLLTSGDFNGDGIDDLLWRNTAGATSEWLMSANGSLGSNPPTPAVQGWNLLATADFNGDGIKDLMWRNAESGTTSEWLMSANGGLGSNPATPGAAGWYLLSTGDFNGDSIQDLMWKDAPTGTTSEWLMSANGGLGSNPATPGVPGWNMVASGDFNGDGIDDLMWQNPLTGATSEWLMSAQGGLGGNPATPGAQGWNVAASGKLDGGGIQDVMWENGLSGATSEWLMSGTGGLGGNPATPGAQGWNLVASGDFNGDGITDLMWQNAATGATSEWLMSAAGGLGSNPATPSAQGWNLVASGDFNGDGIDDLMWQNAATGVTSEWLMSANGGLASNPSTPAAAGAPTAASFMELPAMFGGEGNGTAANPGASAGIAAAHAAHAAADFPFV